MARIDVQQWLRWGKRLGGYSAAQLFVQGVSAIVGFILVRQMTKPEYAWFSIANSMAATFALLTDSGIGVGIQSIGGGVWHDRDKLANVMAAGLRLRRRFATIAAMVTAPCTVWLLWRNGASGWTTFAVTLLVILPSWLTTSFQVLNNYNRLLTRIRELVRIDLLGALARLIVVIIAWPAGVLGVMFATLATSFSQVAQWVLVRKQVLPHLNLDTADPRAYQSQMISTVKHCLPGAIYTCIQGQTGTWILSVYGGVTSVADLGALNRLAIIFSLIQAPMHAVVAPAFARCQTRSLLPTLALKVVCGYLALCMIVVLGCTFFSKEVLWVLGSQYQNLGEELFWAVMLFSLSGLASLIWMFSMARGWVAWGWVGIPTSILGQIVGIYLFDLNTVKNVILFSIVQLIPVMLFFIWVFWRGFKTKPTMQ